MTKALFFSFFFHSWEKIEKPADTALMTSSIKWCHVEAKQKKKAYILTTSIVVVSVHNDLPIL